MLHWDSKIADLKKFTSSVDRANKYVWESGNLKDEDRIRPRDWFIDYKDLLDKSLLTQKTFDDLYNKAKSLSPISIERDFTDILSYEDDRCRKSSIYSSEKGSVATGTYQIGTGGGADYTTVNLFEADIDATLTGDLTGECQDEETDVGSAVIFDLDTATHLLKLTAESGAEHTGGAYGNGARIRVVNYDRLEINETSDGDLDDMEVSNLAFDLAGTDCIGWQVVDGGNSGVVTFNRLLIQGTANSKWGIRVQGTVTNTSITNCIIYGVGDGAGDYGIGFSSVGAGDTHYCCNNTVIGCYDNFVQDGATLTGTFTFKNNLAQEDGGGSDYRDDGGGFGTTAKNVSEDATSPDGGIYDNLNCHDATSCFVDYASDDYRLDSGGSEISTLDDGDDLSGIFTDDVAGTIRDTWYIGASEIEAAGGNAPTGALYGPLVGPMGGPI